MPLITLNDCPHYFRLEGLDDRPVIMLSHSLGLDHGMWDPQVSDLLPHFRILRYDTRGHGASGAPPSDYSIEQLARDALGLADVLRIERFAFCGVSLGGMIGQWLAIHAPDRISHLVLANTSPRPDAQAMETRRRTVLERGMAAVEELVMGRFFSAASLAGNSPVVASARLTLLSTSATGYAGCCAAVRDMDTRAEIARITAPTLIISGDFDQSLPWKGHSELLEESIPDATSVHLPTAHLSNLERPRSFSAALFEFLTPLRTDAFSVGETVRRAVLGDAHVDRITAAATDFTQDFQELITAYVWGTIWTRPGLDARTRRLLVLTTTAALGRWEEFRLHVRTGLAHGLEPCDIKELLLQVAVYAGVPAANTAFHIASEEVKAAESKKNS